MAAYYNDSDPTAAAWLRELIRTGHLPPGDVDDRPIQEVRPEALASYTAVHLFAGIGGWPLAIRLAGWSDDRPVWTGSCPCQPFSTAGKRKGTADARHLWPEMRRLVAECRPPVCFGEQVASKGGRGWLAGVRADLETLGYAVGAADLCAAGVGSPHIRQRLFWVADAQESGGWPDPGAVRGGEAARLRGPEGQDERGAGVGAGGACDCGTTRGVADADGRFPGDRGLQPGREHGRQPEDGGSGFWSAFDLIPCRDGKARRVEPGTFPLAHGVPGRVGLLRGYGNAIVPQVAAEFVSAYLEVS